MKLDLLGRIKNTQLGRSRALLPVFEAVVNSFQAIEDRTAHDHEPRIEVSIDHQAALPDLETKGEVVSVKITDNGIGFTEENLLSFFTSDSRHKLNRGGKGVGRFSWLKAFERADITSVFFQEGRIWKRDFTFSTNVEEYDSQPDHLKEGTVQTTVHLVGLRSPYREECPRGIDVIGRRLIEHCLPFFLDSKCPRVIIRDEEGTLDLRQTFAKMFADKATDHEFTVGGEVFRLKGLKFYNPQEAQHRLIYAANSREVFPERLDKFLPNLQKTLSDDGRPFVYLGFLQGDYLDQNVNSERTQFSFPTDDASEPLLKEISLETLRRAALARIEKDLSSYFTEINKVKRELITEYINTEAPEYLFLRKHLDEFIDAIPPGTKGLSLEIALHEQVYKKKRDLKQETKKLLDENVVEALKPEEYAQRLKLFLEKANELGKSSLAQYVIHRKVILDFLERSLRLDPETDKYPLEDVIHRIIYPMRSTSEDVPYDQQNLWIIDERLSFHTYLASDLPLHDAEQLNTSSRSRPDLLIFDRALSFGEDEGTLGSIVVIEFKRPDRGDYKKEDPIDQVYRLIRQIRTGYFKDKYQREIKLKSPDIPAYAYIIADTVKQLEDIAENKGFMRTPDRGGWYVYNQNLSTYVEIISYQKLMDDAKRRNRVLFDRLHLPLA